jgi:hypothetical protein
LRRLLLTCAQGGYRLIRYNYLVTGMNELPFVTEETLVALVKDQTLLILHLMDRIVAIHSILVNAGLASVEELEVAYEIQHQKERVRQLRARLRDCRSIGDLGNEFEMRI